MPYDHCFEVVKLLVELNSYKKEVCCFAINDLMRVIRITKIILFAQLVSRIRI